METWKSKPKLKSSLPQQKTLFDLFQRKPRPVETLHETLVSRAISIDDHGTMAHDVAVTLSQNQSLVDVNHQKRDIALTYNKPLHPFFAKKALIEASPFEVAEAAQIIDNELNYPSLPLSQDRGSKYDPITIDSPPSKSTLRDIVAGGNDSIPSSASPPPNLWNTPTRLSKLKEYEAPYPAGLTQHIRGPQGTFLSHYRYPRRTIGSHGSTTRCSISMSPSSCTWSVSGLLLPPVPVRATQVPSIRMPNQGEYPATIPDEHQRLHSAISRVVDCISTTAKPSSFSVQQPSNKSWVDKWRPTRAAEVLGNEANALYLRDWLRALELQLNASSKTAQHPGNRKGRESTQASKRRRVVRTVEKHRGRKKRKLYSDDDDWIVADDVVEEEIPQSDDVYGELNLETDYPLDNDLSHVSHHAFNPLTNTILLVGPPGTGKTAAAYACAQELDWEVFEVYPGINRRNGASIDSMVGEVGKNHLVRKSKTRNDEGVVNGHGFFGSVPGQSTAKAGGAVPNKQAVEPDQKFGFVSRFADELSNEENRDAIPRQSIILLEEVDILFKDDTGFWPAITNLIKTCKRPIICTCNDLSLVPIQDLPLQTIISFQPCSASIAASYLQGLCYIEGYSIERDSLIQIYNSPSRLNPLDIPNTSIPPLYQDISTCDLRRTINQLELWCTTTNPQQGDIPMWEGDHTNIEDFPDWAWTISTDEEIPTGFTAGQIHTVNTGIDGLPIRQPAAYHADLISFVDSNLMWSAFDTPSALAMRSLEASADDEIGHPILYDPIPTNKGIEFNGRGEEIASTVLQISRGILEAGTTRHPTSIVKNSFRTNELFDARMSHQLKMGELMQGFVPPSVWITARIAVYLDYAPCIREIIATEDREEVIFSQKVQTGRITRNSGGIYERTFAVSREMREALDSTRLG